MNVSTIEQMRQMDNTAINQYGIPEIVLMENAGQAVFELIRSNMPLYEQLFTVICGAGNNGGDGLVTSTQNPFKMVARSKCSS